MDFAAVVAAARDEFRYHATYDTDGYGEQQTAWSAALFAVEKVTNLGEAAAILAEADNHPRVTSGLRLRVRPIEGASQLEVARLLIAPAVEQLLKKDHRLMRQGPGATKRLPALVFAVS